MLEITSNVVTHAWYQGLLEHQWLTGSDWPKPTEDLWWMRWEIVEPPEIVQPNLQDSDDILPTMARWGGFRQPVWSRLSVRALFRCQSPSVLRCTNSLFHVYDVHLANAGYLPIPCKFVNPLLVMPATWSREFAPSSAISHRHAHRRPRHPLKSLLMYTKAMACPPPTPPLICHLPLHLYQMILPYK